MKVLSKNTKKIFFSIALIFAFVFLNNSALIFNMINSSAYVYEEVGAVSMENSDFTSYSRGANGSPYSLTSGWTLEGDLHISKGVIDARANIFTDNNKFGLKENPGIHEEIKNDHEKFILMFNSPNQEGKAYAQSKNTKLEKGKFYEITIFVKTTDGAIASIDSSFGKQMSFYGINTNNNWTTYTLLVATDYLSSKDFSLSLNYGANKESATKGAVFFDHIMINEISNKDFINSTTSYSTKKLDLRREFASIGFNNSNFETDLNDSDWTIASIPGSPNANISISSIDMINSIINTQYNESGSTNYASNFVNGNTKALFFNNVDATTSTIESSKTNTLTIPQHSFYKVSLFYKTGNTSDKGLNIKLEVVKDDGSIDADYKPVEQTNLSSESNKIASYNNFAVANFYIKGSFQKDTKIKITISFGEGKGWAIVDDIKFLSLTEKEFSDEKSSSILNIIPEGMKESSALTNGYFDLTSNADYSITYPLAPKDWEYTGNDSSKSGVIRINPKHFVEDSKQYGGPANPGINTAYYKNIIANAENFNENVLMIRNTSKSLPVSYKSKASTISANSDQSKVAKFTIGIKTVGDAKAFVQLVNDKGDIVGVIDNISTKNNDWEEYTLYVKNGLTDLSLSLVLGVSSTNNSFAFFDCADFNSSLSTAPTLNEMISNTSTYVDLINNGFYSHSNIKTNGVYTSYDFKPFEKTATSVAYTSGVVTTGDEKILPHSDIEDNNVFKISNVVNGHQHLITNYPYSLKENQYYEISVWIKTNFTNTTLNGEKYGAYFEYIPLDKDGNVVENKASNSNKFTDIQVTEEDNNGWVKYSMYLLCKKEQQGKIILGLGTSENPTQGIAYFDDLTVKNITDKEYSNQKATATTIVSDAIELPKEDDKKEEDTTTPAEQPSINIWALVSSILLVVALLLAIAGYLIRQIPKKKNSDKKIKDSTYTKPRTELDINAIKDEINLKLIKDRSELEAELDSLTQEYNELKTQYDKDCENQEDKTNNKLYAEFTKKANKLNKKIQYLQSALTYIKDEFNLKLLEKRVIRQKRHEAQVNFEKLNTPEEEVAEEKITEEKSSKKKN